MQERQAAQRCGYSVGIVDWRGKGGSSASATPRAAGGVLVGGPGGDAFICKQTKNSRAPGPLRACGATAGTRRDAHADERNGLTSCAQIGFAWARCENRLCGAKLPPPYSSMPPLLFLPRMFFVLCINGQPILFLRHFLHSNLNC